METAPPVAFAKDFLSILDLASVDLDRLLATAAQMKIDRRLGRQTAPALAGLHVALLFEKPRCGRGRRSRSPSANWAATRCIFRRSSPKASANRSRTSRATSSAGCARW